MQGIPKYSKDAPFEDPIVRCASCQTLLLRENLSKYGQCTRCGHRRVINVLAMTPEEWENIKTLNLDPEFMKLFEVVE